MLQGRASTSASWQLCCFVARGPFVEMNKGDFRQMRSKLRAQLTGDTGAERGE
jgi:hypothetical protein